MDVKMRAPTGKTRQRRQRATPVEQVVYMRLLWVFPLTALAAALAATVVHTFASTMGAIPQTVRVPGPMGEQPLTLGSVVIIAVMVTVWAIIAFVLPGLFASRPISMFRNIALVMLLLSFILPLTV